MNQIHPNYIIAFDFYFEGSNYFLFEFHIPSGDYFYHFLYPQINSYLWDPN